MRIMLAVDGSLSANHAADALVTYVAQLRDRPEIDVVFVHLPVRRVDSLGLLLKEPVWDELYKENAQPVLEHPRRVLSEAKLAFRTHVLVGNDPADSLCSFAREHGIDLIFMGTRGLGAIASLFLGSTAQQVLHTAHVPVLLVPAEDRAHAKTGPRTLGSTMRT